MKVSPELVGHMITVQLARPLYMIDYVAHLKYSDGRTLLMGEPMKIPVGSPGTNQEMKPVLMDILYGVTVVDVTDDSMTVKQLTPSQASVVHTFPSSLILNIAEVVSAIAEELPTATTTRREVASAPGASKIIL